MSARFVRTAFMMMVPALAVPCVVAAQGTGRIVGRVLDGASGRPLAGAQVVVQNGTQRAVSGVDGRYALSGVPAGPHGLVVTHLGYAMKTVTGIQVPSGGAAEMDVTLAAEALALEGLTVSASRERGSVSRALDEQRSAPGITSATTSEQIARSPDSDAAQAVQRVSGVTVQDGKYVFVRGLGERYTVASLNGSRIPSPEPEKKVVPLDLFPSNLLEAITTSKTFTPDQPGDFSGASVNLRTRSFPARRTATLSLTSGYNGGVTGRRMLTAPSSGGDWLALGASDRRLPSGIEGTDFTRVDQGEINSLLRSFRNTWSARETTASPNLSMNATVGGEDPVLGRRVGYIGSLSYGRSQDVRLDEVRASAVPADRTGVPRPYNVFHGTSGTESVLWGGLLDLTTWIGTGSRIELNNSYNRSADNEAHQDWGQLEEFSQIDSVQRTTLRYVERSVRSSQLRGEHQLGGRHRLDWSLTSSGVTRREPDRSDLAYGYVLTPTGQRRPLSWLGFSDGSKRTFGDLTENALDGRADYTLSFGRAGNASLRVGGAVRGVRRDARSESYNILPIGLTPQQKEASPEEIFSQYAAGNAALLTLSPNSAGGSYRADDRVSAGYGMVEYPLLGDRVRVIAGARMESWRLRLDAEPTTGGTVRIPRNETDILPSLVVNYSPTDAQTIRLSATQTLSRPEYRELAPISYRDVIGEREVFGDSTLQRALIRNFDARWEWYPASDEVVSVGAFAKHFLNPIEPIDVATSGASQLSFTNAAGADNYGVELELRKGLGMVAPFLERITMFTNATLMRSRIHTGNSRLSALTNDDRPMVGQAPYVVNTGLTYASGSGDASATLLYNVVGKRITSAAVTPLRYDTYEMPRQVLDLSLRFPLLGGLSGRFDARNLLDSPYEEKQGDVVRERYTTGRVFSLGVTLKR